MFLTPYDTTIASSSAALIKRKVLVELETARIENALTVADERFPTIYAVVGKSVSLDRIVAFSQPVVHEGKTYIDLRSFNAQVNYGGTYRTPTEGAAGFMLKQAILQQGWGEEKADRQSLWLMSSLPCKVYSSWVSELMTVRLSLDYPTQMKVAALAAWFYVCLFLTENEREHDSDLAAVKLSRVSDLPIELCREATQAGYLNNTDAFCAAVRQTGSLKLGNLTDGVFYSIMAGSWFGAPTAKESVAVALEHPPTFIALVHTVCNERVYNKTPIFLSARNALKRDALEQFNRSFQSFVRQLGS